MASKSRNVRNSESFLFKALTRLFSGPIVNYKAQSPSKIKRKDLDKYRFKSAQGLAFKKSGYDPFSNIYRNAQANAARNERYIEFEQMEFESLIATALDIYADNMTTSSRFTPMLSIVSENNDIKEILENLFFDTLNIELNAYYWCRELCKNGDFFVYLDLDEEYGVKNVITLPVNEVERLEGEDKTNPQYIQFQWNTGGLTFENWQIAHFRIIGRAKFMPYGMSVLDPIRRAHRQLDLLINHMMAYRVVRSAEKLAFYIDIAGIPEKDVEQYIQNIISETKRHQVVDEDTGRVDERYNPTSIEENYYLPVRGNNSGTKIDPIPGGQYTGDVDDVNFLQDRLIAGLKIPKAYLIPAEGSTEDKTSLAQKDIVFARIIQRLQKSFISELYKVAIIHLYILGFRGEDLTSFTLHMNNPSRIAEIQELEYWKTKFEAASAASEGFFSKRWISKNILELSEKEIERILIERFHDAKFEGMLQKIEDEEMGNLEGEGGGDALGGDLDGAGSGDSTGDNAEEDVLLAQPKKYSDGSHTTARSKGKKYKPVASDSRVSGARQRHIKSQYSSELGSNTPRNIFKGLGNLNTLAKGIAEGKVNPEILDIITEGLSSIANKNHLEEQKLLESDRAIKNLIKGLEKSEYRNSNLKEKSDEA